MATALGIATRGIRPFSPEGVASRGILFFAAAPNIVDPYVEVLANSIGVIVPPHGTMVALVDRSDTVTISGDEITVTVL